MSLPATIGRAGYVLREALEVVASPELAERLFRAALLAARQSSVPDEPQALRTFVEGPLRQAVLPALGEDAYDQVAHRALHISDSMRPPEDSTVRPTPVPRPTPAEPVQRAPAPIGRMTRPGVRLDIKEEGSGEQALDASPVRRRSPSTDSFRPATRQPSVAVVLSLDPVLRTETEAALRGQCEVRAASTPDELLATLATIKGRAAIVLDTALSPIDLGAFGELSTKLRPSTLVILWGMNEMQRDRLATRFPAAARWVASGTLASPAELILGTKPK